MRDANPLQGTLELLVLKTLSWGPMHGSRRRRLDRAGNPRRTSGQKLILIVALLAAVAMSAAGRAEAQTRADSAAVLLDAADRFEAEGRLDLADALMEMILVRFGDTAAAERVRQAYAVRSPDRGARGGNVELQVWSTLYGAWLGIAIPWMMDADGPEAYGLGLLVGGPTGFLVSRSFAQSRPLTEGQARAITWGGTWGTWQGLGWANVLDLGVKTELICYTGAPCFESETSSTGAIVGSMVAGGLTGIVVGGVMSRKPISAGLATTVNFGSLWSTWFGFAGGYLAGLEDDGLLAASLIAGNAGLVGTALAGPGWNLSRNRARLISLGGVVGGLAGLGIVLVIQPDDGKAGVGIPLATSIGGLVLGTTLTRDYDTALNRLDSPPAGVGAMFRLDDGGWSFDAPAPIPTLVRDETRADRPFQPAVRFTILDARF